MLITFTSAKGKVLLIINNWRRDSVPSEPKIFFFNRSKLNVCFNTS